MSECLWYKRFIKISNKSFIMKTFSKKGVEHVSDILSEKGIIPWEIFKSKYSLTDREHFKWVQLIDAVPKVWKDIIRPNSYENDPSTVLDCSNIIFINQKPVGVKTLTSKVIYAELISRIYKKPTAQQNIETKLRSVASQTINLDWKIIYMLPRKTVISTSIRMFQYRLLNNILYFVDFYSTAFSIFGNSTPVSMDFSTKFNFCSVHMCLNQRKSLKTKNML